MFNTAINTISRLAILGTSSVPNSKDEEDETITMTSSSVPNNKDEDDTIVKGEEFTFPVIFTDYNITEINLYPKYEHSILENFFYDENCHWTVCGCGLEKEISEHDFTIIYDNQFHWFTCSCGFISEKLEHSLGDWQITVQPTETIKGEKCKNCTVCDYKESKTIEKIVRTRILQDSPNYKIEDTGQYGLENSSNSILSLSGYSKYMNDDYVFIFNISISYEAYWWLLTMDGDQYEEGNKQIFLFKKNPGFVADSLKMVNSTIIRSQYGLLKEETWTEDKGTKYFNWNVNGSDCTNNMCIKYDAWGDSEDTWYVKSITVDLLIKPKY